MEKVGILEVFWPGLTTILASPLDQVPELHFNLCQVGNTVSQEVTQGRKPGFWTAVSVPVQHLFWRQPTPINIKAVTVFFPSKISLLRNEPGSFIIGKVFSVLISRLLTYYWVYWVDDPASEPESSSNGVSKQADKHVSQRKKMSIIICYATTSVTSLILWKYWIFFGLLPSDTWEVNQDRWQITKYMGTYIRYIDIKISEKTTRHTPGLCAQYSIKLLVSSHLSVSWKVVFLFYWI